MLSFANCTLMISHRIPPIIEEQDSMTRVERFGFRNWTLFVVQVPVNKLPL